MHLKKAKKYISGQVRSRLLKDEGALSDLVILAGMGRSGTTWAGNIINYDNSARMMFEPFLPSKVKEASVFKYLQYIDADECQPELEKAAKAILAGDIRSYWVDRENTQLRYKKRIVKDIRCNLMLAWLRNVSNCKHLVLMVRHPLQVVASWKKLGWGTEYLGDNSDFSLLIGQPRLLEDFPIIQHVRELIDPTNFVENIVFQWCVYHLVPAKQIQPNQMHVMYYENLITDKKTEAKRLFEYLGVQPSEQQIESVLSQVSSTNFQQRDLEKDKIQMLSGWKNSFSQQDIHKANEILSVFGLDYLYDSDGFPTGKSFSLCAK